MKFRRIPKRVRWLRDFHLADIRWNALMIPIGVAFFFRSSATGRVTGIYPSPAGPTESLLDLNAWNEIAGDNRILDTMETDTEALLVNRLNESRDYYILPIDECYRRPAAASTASRGGSRSAGLPRE